MLGTVRAQFDRLSRRKGTEEDVLGVFAGSKSDKRRGTGPGRKIKKEISRRQERRR